MRRCAKSLTVSRTKRNLARQDYSLQGWRKHRIYPDFIVSEADRRDRTDYSKVYVVETKGIHLGDNADTNYKRDVFTLCNKLADERSWTELGLKFPEKKVAFVVIFQDEWQKRINALFA